MVAGYSIVSDCCKQRVLKMGVFHMGELGKDLAKNALGVWIGLVTLVAFYYIVNKTPLANVSRIAQKLSTPGSN